MIVAWGKFRKLFQSSPQNIFLLLSEGKFFFYACVRSAILHGGETWVPNVLDLQMLKRNDRTFAVPDTRGRGRSRKTWTECVVYDLRFFDIRFLAINTLSSSD